MSSILRSEINPIPFQAIKTSPQQSLTQFLFQFHKALAELGLLYHRCFKACTEQGFNIGLREIFSSKHIQMQSQELAEVMTPTEIPARTVLCKQLLSPIDHPVMIRFVEGARNNYFP